MIASVNDAIENVEKETNHLAQRELPHLHFFVFALRARKNRLLCYANAAIAGEAGPENLGFVSGENGVMRVRHTPRVAKVSPVTG